MMISSLRWWPENQGNAFFLSLFVASLLLFVIFFRWFFTTSPGAIIKRAQNSNPPPSPRQLPILGNLHQLGSLPHRSLRSLARRHGPHLTLLRFGRVPVLVASSPAAARDILKTHDLAFSTRPKLIATQKLFYGAKDISAAPYGEYWRQVRSISVLHLLSNRRVGSFGAVRHEETALLLQKIKAAAGTAVDLSQVLLGLTFDLTSRAAMGRKYGEGEDDGGKFRDKLDEFGRVLGFFNVADFIPWLGWVNIVSGYTFRTQRLVQDLDSLLDGIIQEHVDRRERDSGGDGGDQKDFVDVLLDVQRDNVNVSGFPLGSESIKALILDAFAAGTDTTFAVLEWGMTELLRHPEMMEKLQEEVGGIIKPNTAIREGDLQNMPYLKAVIKETLRLYPPVPLLVPRESTRDVKVLGHDVAAGTMTIINAWAIGRDPEAWPEAPEEFRPERFLNSSVDFKGQDYEFIPFGAGRRGCPGIWFAVATVELVLASLVGSFDWRLPEGGRGEDLDVSEVGGVTLHRKTPLVAVATLRA